MSLGERFATVLTAMGLTAVFTMAVTAIPAWITHIVVCIRDESYLLLIAGAIMFPVGIIHGWGCWFGWWS